MPRCNLAALQNVLMVLCGCMVLHIFYSLTRFSLPHTFLSTASNSLVPNAFKREIKSLRDIDYGSSLIKSFKRPIPSIGLSLQKRSEPILLTKFVPNTTALPIHSIFLSRPKNNSELQSVINSINAEQRILNSDIYTEPLENVLVVQVHDRIEYFLLLIDSLRRVKDIQRTLLVFSHDVFDVDINVVVQSIRFARVIQIFFPYSQQLHSHSFPGEHPNDCPRDLSRPLAIKRKCNNALSPDKYGHYREAKYTQTKHHWIYKANFVFERLIMLRNYSGMVLFLEEDHYLSEDALHMLNLMKQQKELHSDVDILCLGTYEKRPVFNRDTGQVSINRWISSFHNMGFGFSRELWNVIKSCAKNFCTFDDYNWDWSLMHISQTCRKRPFMAMVIRTSPRVFHIGECGLHHRSKKGCSPVLLVRGIDSVLNDNIANLYPDRLSVKNSMAVKGRPMKPNGGWGDSRDQKLCLSYFFNDSHAPEGLPDNL